jgi:hypothetical protein
MKIPLAGPSYTSRSVTAAAQQTMNLYPETIEVPNEPARLTLYGRPGLKAFASLTPTKIRALWAGGGRLFAIHGPNETEVHSDGTTATLATTLAQGTGSPDPAQIFSNGHQLMIISGNKAYLDNGAGAVPMKWTLGGQCNTNNATRGVFRTSGDAFLTGWNGQPIMIDGNQYVIQTVTDANNLTVTTAAVPPTLTGVVWRAAQGNQVDATTGAFLDGYFIVSRVPTPGFAGDPGRQFNISDLNDGYWWDPLMFAVKEGAPDYIRALFADHEELYLFGSETTEIWSNVGDPNFPFQRIGGAFIHEGISAVYAPCSVGQSICGLAGGANGQTVAFRIQGLQPQRISTHAQEDEWRQPSYVVSDAVSYGYTEGGHTFWVVNFWAQQRTWVYDLTTGLWHERAGWDATNKLFIRHKSWFHAFVPEWGANGKHIVGDPTTGFLFEMSLNFTDDAPELIEYRRAFPHLLNEDLWNFHHRLEVYCETGTVAGGHATPNVTLDWSDDRGHTFINARTAPMGAAAEYKRRVAFRRLGKARDRVYRVSIESAEKLALIDTFLEMTPGTA